LNRQIIRRGLVILALIILTAGVIANRQIFNRPVRRPGQFICPLRTPNAPIERATCTDCALYPVDKSHALPANYAPELVDTGLPGGGRVSVAVRDPLVRLFEEANRRLLFPVVTSAYRSYSDQQQVFKRWLIGEFRTHGDIFKAFNETQRYSAYPGHSEHQLGTAIDVNCLGCAAFDTDHPRNRAIWDFLEQEAHKFGFIVSYPRAMEARTGYQYEPWHIRYIGVENATALYEDGYIAGNGSCAAALLRTIR
jgi:zinc D-Ala-D-Ala carboxypeptidase